VTGGAIPLSPLDLVLAAGFVLVAGLVSLGLGLRLEGRLAVATVRAVVQLLAIGLVLRWVFEIHRPAVLALVTVGMIAAAAQSAVARPERRIRAGYALAFATLFVVGFATTLLTTAVVVGAEPWWAPRYVVPLLGMVLGNTLTALSLTLDDLLAAFSDGRPAIEEELALGASAWEAARPAIGDAVRRGLVPILNTLSVVGIVSLPGMMTGQILAGADPMLAVQYQLVVLFMIAAAVALGAVLLGLLVFRRVFNDRQQLRDDVIGPSRRGR